MFRVMAPEEVLRFPKSKTRCRIRDRPGDTKESISADAP